MRAGEGKSWGREGSLASGFESVGFWRTEKGRLRMDEKQRLGRDVFIALAAIGWADGKLDSEEADAIVRTALDEGLEIEEIAEIEEATKKPVEIGVIDRAKLSKEDRLFVYAVASWITRIDGNVDAKELDALVKLAEALKFPQPPRN